MDFRKLGNALIVAGALALIAAILWWFSFFSSLARDVGKATGVSPDATKITDALSCLYSSSGICAVVSTVASVAGRTPYEPMLFWFAVAALLLGVLIRYTAKSGAAA